MNILVALSALLLVGFATAHSAHDDILTITKSFYTKELVVYTGENDITKIVVPLNSFNFNENTDIDNVDVYAFFVEAQKGLYVLKNREASKVLDNGKDVASSMDDSTQVFIAATDGIYTFNAEKNTAEKYGTLKDNIRNIAVTNETQEIFILTEDNILYKVTEQGTKKEEVGNVKDAQQIVLDTTNNLYFTDSKNRVYVRNFKTGTVKRVKGLPERPNSALLVRPPAVIDDAVLFFAGKKLYKVNVDGTSEFGGLVVEDGPTAYCVEASIIVYFAYEKQIYQYDVMDLIASTTELMTPVKTYLNNKASDIKEMAKKKTFRQ